jgi:retinol dehydrogenase-12
MLNYVFLPGQANLIRYQVSKLLEVLFVRELVSRLSATSAPEVPIVMVNPGLCKSELVRDVGPVTKFIVSILMGVFARTTEVGSRTLVIGTTAGKESHGEFMSDGVNQEIEGWIYGDLGKKAQKKVWEQTVKILEERKPGVLKGVGL